MDSRAKAGVAIAVGAVVMAAVGGVVAWRHGVFDRPSDPVAVERIGEGSAGHADAGTAGQAAAETDDHATDKSADLSGTATDERSAPSAVPVAEWRVAPMTVFYRGGDGVSRAEAPRPMGQALEPTHQAPRPMQMEAAPSDVGRPVVPALPGPQAIVEQPLINEAASGPKPMSKDEFFK